MVELAVPKYVKPSGVVVYGAPGETVTAPSGSSIQVPHTTATLRAGGFVSVPSAPAKLTQPISAAPTKIATIGAKIQIQREFRAGAISPAQVVRPVSGYAGAGVGISRTITPRPRRTIIETKRIPVTAPAYISEFKKPSFFRAPIQRTKYELGKRISVAERGVSSAEYTGAISPGLTAFGLGAVKGAVGVAEAVISPVQTVKGVYGALSRPRETALAFGRGLRERPSSLVGELVGATYAVKGLQIGLKEATKLSPFYDPTLTKRVIPSTIQTTQKRQLAYAGKEVKLYSATEVFKLDPGKKTITVKTPFSGLGAERRAFLKKTGLTEKGIFLSPEKISEGFAISKPSQRSFQVLEVQAKIPKIKVPTGIKGRLALIKSETLGKVTPGRLAAGIGTELEFRIPEASTIYLKETLRSKAYKVVGIQRGGTFGYSPTGRKIELFSGSLTVPKVKTTSQLIREVPSQFARRFKAPSPAITPTSKVITGLPISRGRVSAPTLRAPTFPLPSRAPAPIRRVSARPLPTRVPAPVLRAPARPLPPRAPAPVMRVPTRPLLPRAPPPVLRAPTHPVLPSLRIPIRPAAPGRLMPMKSFAAPPLAPPSRFKIPKRRRFQMIPVPKLVSIKYQPKYIPSVAAAYLRIKGPRSRYKDPFTSGLELRTL